MQFFKQLRAARRQNAHGFRFVDYVEEVVALEEPLLYQEEGKAQSVPDHADIFTSDGTDEGGV